MNAYIQGHAVSECERGENQKQYENEKEHWNEHNWGKERENRAEECNYFHPLGYKERKKMMAKEKRQYSIAQDPEVGPTHRPHFETNQNLSLYFYFCCTFGMRFLFNYLNLLQQFFLIEFTRQINIVKGT